MARASTRVVRVEPADRATWQAIYESDPFALPEQAPVWVDALRASGRFDDVSKVFELSDSRRVVLPLVRRRGRPAALSSVSTFAPSWGIGGLVGPGIDVPTVRAVMSSLASERHLRVHVRPNPLHARAWDGGMPRAAHRTPRRAHVLDLTPGESALWRASSCRSQVRRAERLGVEVMTDCDGDLLATYYELFLRSVERWAGHQHEPVALARWRATRRDPLTKLDAWRRELGGAFRLYAARYNGEVVSATLVLIGDHAAHLTRSAMDTELTATTRANELVVWTAIRDAVAAGCEWFHFGESGGSRSLSRWKEKFGAVPVDYAEYDAERIPMAAWSEAARSVVKRAIGFRDHGREGEVATKADMTLIGGERGVTTTPPGYASVVTSPLSDDDPRVQRRAELLDAERRAGSDDPVAQAKAILEEGDERTRDRNAAPGSVVEHRRSEDTVDPRDIEPSLPSDPAGQSDG